ncbi:MAG: flagellar basal-body rod protein FlgG [bacterium]
MLSQLHMAKSALYSFQRKMQVITNNISNAQTPGYKERRLEMESLFPLIFERAVTESDEETGSSKRRKKYIEFGQGVRFVGITKNFSTGTIEVTNRQMDMAIEGNGMFQFQLPDGSAAYSRAGNFHVDSQGRVLNSSGHPLDPPLTIPLEAREIIVNQEGRIFALLDGDTQQQEIGQMVLAKFMNPEGLKDIGQNLMQETESSGDPQLIIPGEQGMGSIRQRSLEFSNVDIISEMMEMLMCQRSFETVIKAMKASDDMLKAGSDIK